MGNIMEDFMVTAHTQTSATQPRLLDQVRDVLRFHHYSIRTEESYLLWIRRFIYFHNKRHPRDMGAKEVESYLTHLAVVRNVSPSTQNQALSALLFLYQKVLKIDLPWMNDIHRAKKAKRLPVVFTRDEVKYLLAQFEGTKWLIFSLLYGTGMRIMECLRLRVKDIDFSGHEIIIRDGKGGKDRLTLLPELLTEPLRDHLVKVRYLHEHDIANGYGTVYLPYALERKYPSANKARLRGQSPFRRSTSPRLPDLTLQFALYLFPEIVITQWGTCLPGGSNIPKRVFINVCRKQGSIRSYALSHVFTYSSIQSMRCNDWVPLSLRIGPITAPTVLTRIVYHTGTHRVEFDIAHTGQ